MNLPAVYVNPISTGHLYRSLLDLRYVLFSPSNPLEDLLAFLTEDEVGALFDGSYAWYNEDLFALEPWDTTPITHYFITSLTNHLYMEDSPQRAEMTEEQEVYAIKHALLDAFSKR